MKKNKNRTSPLTKGVLTAVAAFILLSIFVSGSGLVVISQDGSVAQWAFDVVGYSIATKFASKLAASLLIGICAGFLFSMIAYGKNMNRGNQTRTTSVPFNPTPSGHDMGRIA